MMELAIWVCYLRAIRCCWLFLFMSFFLLFMVFQSISHILASVKKLWTLSKWNGMKSTNEKRNDDIEKWIKKKSKNFAGNQAVHSLYHVFVAYMLFRALLSKNYVFEYIILLISSLFSFLMFCLNNCYS